MVVGVDQLDWKGEQMELQSRLCMLVWQLPLLSAFRTKLRDAEKMPVSMVWLQQAMTPLYAGQLVKFAPIAGVSPVRGQEAELA